MVFSEHSACNPVLTGLIPLFIVLLIVRRVFRTKPARLPPGPPALPLIGNLLDLRPEPHISLTQLAKKYGSIYRFYFSDKICIVLNDYESIKKAFSNEHITGRMRGTIVDYFIHGKGLIMSDGELWKEHRRFALSTLRDLGMGRSSIQERILEEAEEICSVLQQQKGEPFDPEHLITAGVSNITCAAVFGKRFSHDDKQFKTLLRVLKDSLKSFGQSNLLVLFPGLRFLPYFRGQFQKMSYEDDFFFGFIGEMIEDAKKRGTQPGAAPDYVNAFMKVAENSTDPDTTFEPEQLKISVGNMFVAGTETTSNTLLLSFIRMVENPEVMHKIQKEIDAVVGKGGQVRMEHRGHLPFTEATIQEVLRLHPVAPLGVFHRATEDTTIGGFDVPQDTLVISNLYAVHHDPDLWEDPEKFDPNRFIDESTGHFVKSPFVIPFSVGKRACLGESLANMELLLFFANIIHKFDLIVPKGQTVSSKNVHVAVTMTPEPFELCFKARL